MTNANRTAAYGAVHALIAVALGAFAAHALKQKLDEDMLAVFETGVRYQMYHGLGLVLIGLAAGRGGSAGAYVWAGRLLHIGIFLFAGSLYALTLSGVKWLGAITPLGGVAFLIGWALFARALWRGSGERG